MVESRKEETRIDAGLQKLDADLAFMMAEFATVLKEVGDGEIVSYLPWFGDRVPLEEACTPRLVQAYSIAFQLLNMAEENSANQLRRMHERERGVQAWRGLWGAQLKFLQEAGKSQEEIAEALGRVRVEPVLTAHPTEAKRITVLEQHRDLYLAHVSRENSMWTPSEIEDISRKIRSILERLWRTGEIYLTKPSVEMERQGIEYYLTQIFPEAIGKLDRHLEHAWESLGFDRRQLHEHFPTLRFGTWVGGDRDGHPFVTPEVTEKALLSFRLQALHIHKRSLEQLRAHLSLSESLQPVPECLANGIAQQWDILGGKAAKLAERNEDEPWRQFVSMMIARLPLSDRMPTDQIELSTNYFTSYRFPSELLADLQLLRKSLDEIGAQFIIEEDIDVAIRLCKVFGFHLATLDIRQNSAFHEKAIEQVLAALGEKDREFSKWPEDKRVAFLSENLNSPERRLLQNAKLEDEAENAIRTFSVVARHIRRYGTWGVGALILSMTRSLSDLLGVYFLAREGGLLEADEEGRTVCPLPVTPLLETVGDLENGARIMREFLAHPVTKASLEWQRRIEIPETDVPIQQVMIGYSDSNKDRGIFASQWALHQGQSEIARVAEEANVRIRFFHGRGGTIGRGAGPSHHFLEALPDRTLNYDLRITEQGEAISQKYANLLTATYNLELLAAGTCRFSALGSREDVDAEFREIFQFLADRSADAYSELLSKDGFIGFYRQATPIDVLELSRIGSRPSRRTGTHSLSDLRAIPWVFSWSQSRFFLPGWYGVGSALQLLET
ncbi:MAG: phosphoenolpyruvate carboxylase, partial [Candidatus Omnitrophica bacterium]|nr:phosphoenolpyruvate carboxylase [Candidatus Omnitrophota bacterium]